MGIWGTGIYSNDTAEDVREMCKELFPFVDVEEGNKIIFQEFKEIMESDIVDNDYASFWYALADWQWKHGILRDDIRRKAIELLSDYEGIDEWEEFESGMEIRKRKMVMDKLKLQLESPMPPLKLPKSTLAKPKHKAGDIIVFMPKADQYDTWIHNRGSIPFGYQSLEIRDSGEFLSNPVSAVDKYLAILCVGTKKELYSEHLKDIYEEKSVYAFYDYCDVQKPTVDILNKCGFLPHITYCFNSEELKYENFKRVYQFTISSSFLCHTEICHSMEKFKSLEELNRFHSLLRRKRQSDKSVWMQSLYDAFSSFFEEKSRLSELSIETDTLLNTNIIAPPLRTEVKLECGEKCGHGV